MYTIPSRVWSPLPAKASAPSDAPSQGPGITMIFAASNGEDPFIDFSQIVNNSLRITEGDLTKAAEYIVAHRREQTLSGIDSRGEPFQEYSPSYEKRKGSSNVNLRGNNDQDHMTDALDFRVFANLRKDGAQAIEIGIMEEPEVILRARLHDQGAVVRTGSYHRMEASGKFTKRKKGDKRRYTRKLFAIIPQRAWLRPSPEEIDMSAQIITQSITQRLSFADSPGHRENIVDTSSTRNAGKNFNVPRDRGKIL